MASLRPCLLRAFDPAFKDLKASLTASISFVLNPCDISCVFSCLPDMLPLVIASTTAVICVSSNCAASNASLKSEVPEIIDISLIVLAPNIIPFLLVPPVRFFNILSFCFFITFSNSLESLDPAKACNSLSLSGISEKSDPDTP